MAAFPDNPAMRLLRGEPEGFAIDATHEGGSIAIRDTTTLANNHVISGVTTSIRNGLDSSNTVRAGAVKLVQSGTSAKMVHFPDSPYVRWTPHNLLEQSQTLDDSYWSKFGESAITPNVVVAPDGTLTGDTYNSGIDDYMAVQTPFTKLANTTYTFSIYAKFVDQQWLLLQVDDGVVTDRSRAWFDLQNSVVGTASTTGSGTVSSSITSVGNGWYRLTNTFSNSSTALYIRLIPVTTDGGSTLTTDKEIHYWGAQVNRGSIATPYLVTEDASRIGIPQGYDAAAAQYGMLLEPGATNLLFDSEDFDTGNWNGGGVTVTENDTAAPDGTTTADKLLATAAGEHTRYQGASTPSGTTFTMSNYLKAGTMQFSAFRIRNASNEWGGATFDLVNVTVTQILKGSAQTLMPTATITAIGDGWCRCTMTIIFDNAATSPEVGAWNGCATGTPAQGGTGGSVPGDASGLYAYAWGAQLEVGTVATSYIPTLGSTSTRADDIVGAEVGTLSATENTFYIDLTLFEDVGGDYFLAYATPPGYPNIVGFRNLGPGNETEVYVRAGGVDQFISNFDTANPTQVRDLVFPARYQGTIATKLNDYAWSAQGFAAGTDTSADHPTALTGFIFGELEATVRMFVRRFVVVPRRVIDADLPTWRYEA